MADFEPSYIDYESFLDPSFSSFSFANSLVKSTNNPTDTPLDLNTPLSRVLFDVQEIDAHIHTLTTKSATPLLTYTRDQNAAAQRILHAVETQVSALTDGYDRLDKDVLNRWEKAEAVRRATERSLATVKLARAAGRCLMLGRQLEGQLLEVTGQDSNAPSGGTSSGALAAGNVEREDHRALVRASHTLLLLRRMFMVTGEGEESYGLERLQIIRALNSDLVVPAESTVKAKAQQIVNRFTMPALSIEAGSSISGAALASGRAGGVSSSTPSPGISSTFAQVEETKARMASALATLYLLSPTPIPAGPPRDFQPELLLASLRGYIHSSLTSSLTALSKGLSALPTLDRALLDVSARCQNIVALENLLGNTKTPVHPLLSYEVKERPRANTVEDVEGAKQVGSNAENGYRLKAKENLLQPLLQTLDTSSLPSYFWRSLASSLSLRVQEIVGRGGVSVRTLRSNRDRLRDELRQCVLRGSQLPISKANRIGLSTGAAPLKDIGNWEREAAVMVGAVVGPLGR